MANLWIYRREPSVSARALTRALQRLGVPARRLRKSSSRRINPEDSFVGWGDWFLTASRTLNFTTVHNKHAELDILREADILVPDFSLEEPGSEGWLPRSFNHSGGRDFTETWSRVPDYFTRFVETTHEFRIHIFGGVSIRVGLKVPKENAHRHFRSHALGWRFDYGALCQSKIRQKHRDIAKEAVAALGLDFGAVDVGILPDRSPIVFEVNRAVGFGNQFTTEAYARKVKEWYEGEA